MPGRCAILLAVAAALTVPASMPIAALVAGQAGTAVIYPLPYRMPDPQTSWDLELVALNLINQERVAAGLVPLMPHATIRQAARAHGSDMFEFGYLSHRSRDGRNPEQRVKGLRVRVRMVGENLAYAQDLRAAHEALMASAGHRQNILLPEYRLIGIGVVDGGPLGVVVVQDFSD
ncbi:MAG TPA: CAP domain-containing protein [bacterium]|nr:CAP domain-containing protein [bacterium]